MIPDIKTHEELEEFCKKTHKNYGCGGCAIQTICDDLEKYRELILKKIILENRKQKLAKLLS